MQGALPRRSSGDVAEQNICQGVNDARAYLIPPRDSLISRPYSLSPLKIRPICQHPVKYVQRLADLANKQIMCFYRHIYHTGFLPQVGRFDPKVGLVKRSDKLSAVGI